LTSDQNDCDSDLDNPICRSHITMTCENPCRMSPDLCPAGNQCRDENGERLGCQCIANGALSKEGDACDGHNAMWSECSFDCEENFNVTTSTSEFFLKSQIE